MRKYLCTTAILLTPALALAHGMSGVERQRMLDAGGREFISLGAQHMLTGYDHLLFLFGVIFFLTRFNDIVKFVTAFTLGHSITLIAATLLKVQVNYYLIDAVIALTVVYKGFDNLDGFRKYLKMNSPNLLVAVFVFGLIHGFGLATRLQQLPLGGHESLLKKIIGFNIGVEVGQIAALTVFLFVLAVWRKRPSFVQFSIATNVFLIFIGLTLFLGQLHGYTHNVNIEEFGFNEDAHIHHHEHLDRHRH